MQNDIRRLVGVIPADRAVVGCRPSSSSTYISFSYVVGRYIRIRIGELSYPSTKVVVAVVHSIHHLPYKETLIAAIRSSL